MILLLLTYFSVLFFLILIFQKAFKLASSPVHLRWELYPVPHESKERANYGGSKLEEVDWWTKVHKKNILGELTAMFSEIAFLKGVYEHNKDLWLGSYPFHFGLYFFIINIFLMLIAGILSILGITINSNAFGFWGFYYTILNIILWIGSSIGLIGSIRILFSRIVDKNLSLYSTPSHYFNIVIIGLLYLTALIWLITEPKAVEQMILYYSSILSFSTSYNLPFIGVLHTVIALFLFLYIPFTHMTHFFTKFFTYHKVRWEDEPNVKGAKMQKKIEKQLQHTVTWSAPHIGADGRKNWIAIVTQPVKKENKDAE